MQHKQGIFRIYPKAERYDNLIAVCVISVMLFLRTLKKYGNAYCIIYSTLKYWSTDYTTQVQNMR